MFTLVEPCVMEDLIDRPHLGCAMLIAACQEKGIKTSFIKGQTRYLKDMFLNDAEELWMLMGKMKDEDLREMKILEQVKRIRGKGMNCFTEELKNLYKYVILEKDPRHYFDCQMVGRLKRYHDVFIGTYYYHLVKTNNHRINIIENYIEEIIRSHPRYIGFSLQGEFGPFSRAIRKRIKEMTGLPMIVGGSLTPFIDMHNLEKVLEDEYIDYLIIGPGEQALPQLIEALHERKEPKGISNLFYKKGGRVKGNEQKIIQDFNLLPFPDYSQFDLDYYLSPKRILPLQTARGCSWRKCTFCAHSNIYMGSYRTLKVERVVETIKYLKNKFKCSHFIFHDEELPSVRAEKISKAILKSNLPDISIYTYARLTKGYNNNEILCNLRKAGFCTIVWGMESGCQKVLQLMNKGTNIKTMSQILKKSWRNRIVNICFVIFGFPGERKEDAETTIKYLKSHAQYIEEISHGPFILHKDSTIGKNPAKWGLTLKKDGGYAHINGIKNGHFKKLFSKFNKEYAVNGLKTNSGKFRYLLPGFNRRIVHFLNSSYGLLTREETLEIIKKGKDNDIYPIVLGKIEGCDSRIIFWPVKVDETYFVNRYLPPKKMVISNLEKRILNLCDGALSIEDIILKIWNKHEKGCQKKIIHNKCMEYFMEIYTNSFGLGFSKSWKS